MDLCEEVDPFLGIIDDEKWLSTYSSKVDPSSAVRARFPEFSNSKFNVTEENKMHAEFTRVAQEIIDAGSAAGGRKNSVRTLVVKDTGNHPDIEERKKPDLTFYPNTPEARKAYELSEDERRDAKVTPEERRQYLGRAAWPHACVFVEFKAADHKNPFEKRKDEYMPRDTDDARNARGQMYEYATAIMNAQPRTHVFFISIWRTQATLFYADHSQFVCTKPFTFTGKPSALSTFLYHLGQMASEELGYDSSVTLATVEEVAAVKDVEDQMTEYHQKCVAGAFFSESGWPVYKVILPAEQAGFKQSKEDGVFLIGRPLYKIYSPTGRATKVYAAYNMKTERMVTVKDCWPEEWEEGEHTKYECIEKAGVQYTATCLYGGYVGEQKTKTCDDLKHTHPVRRHYRIVLKELGRPLYSYDSSGELIVAGWCVLTAHHEAWIKCDLLQRDMSPGNMIFDEVDPRDIKDGETPEFRALLIDFHLAKFKHELQDGAKRVGRSGTWQFISARLLMNPTAQNEVADDLESVILIMEWMALRFHEHQYIILEQLDWLKAHVETFFDFRGRDPDNRHVGGAAKYLQWTAGKRIWALSHSDTMPVFVKLLDSLLKLAHNHYVALKAGAQRPAQQTQLAPPTFQKTKQVRLAQQPPMQPEIQAASLEPDRSSAAAVPRGKLCLATHDEIIKVFLEAYQALGGELPFDKVGDQFEAIGMATEKFSLMEDTKQSKQSRQSKQSKKKTTSGQQETGLLRRSTRLSAKASTEGDQAEGSSKPVKRRSGQIDGLEEKDEAKRQATGITRKGSRLRKSVA